MPSYGNGPQHWTAASFTCLAFNPTLIEVLRFGSKPHVSDVAPAKHKFCCLKLNTTFNHLYTGSNNTWQSVFLSGHRSPRASEAVHGGEREPSIGSRNRHLSVPHARLQSFLYVRFEPIRLNAGNFLGHFGRRPQTGFSSEFSRYLRIVLRLAPRQLADGLSSRACTRADTRPERLRCIRSDTPKFNEWLVASTRRPPRRKPVPQVCAMSGRRPKMRTYRFTHPNSKIAVRCVPTFSAWYCRYIKGASVLALAPPA